MPSHAKFWAIWLFGLSLLVASVALAAYDLGARRLADWEWVGWGVTLSVVGFVILTAATAAMEATGTDDA